MILYVRVGSYAWELVCGRKFAFCRKCGRFEHRDKWNALDIVKSLDDKCNVRSRKCDEVKYMKRFEIEAKKMLAHKQNVNEREKKFSALQPRRYWRRSTIERPSSRRHSIARRECCAKLSKTWRIATANVRTAASKLPKHC